MIKVGDFLEVNEGSEYFSQKPGTRYKVVKVSRGKAYWRGAWGQLDVIEVKSALGRFNHIKCHSQWENK